MDRTKIRQFVHKMWREWRLTFFLIVFVVLPVKSSLADFNWVPSGSMKPTILEGDFVFVNKAAYDLRIPLTLTRLATWADPERGDIVICFSPDEGTRLIKRVVGLPGDTLEMRRNRLFINGQFAQQSDMGSQEVEELAALFQGDRVFAQPGGSCLGQLRPGAGARASLFRHGRQPRQQPGFTGLWLCGPPFDCGQGRRPRRLVQDSRQVPAPHGPLLPGTAIIRIRAAIIPGHTWHPGRGRMMIRPYADRRPYPEFL